MAYPASPYIEERDGALRIAGTRVSLASVVIGFQEGESPDQIVKSFPTLTLAQAYGAIAYYLENEKMINEYLSEVQRDFDKSVPPLSQSNPEALCAVASGTREDGLEAHVTVRFLADEDVRADIIQGLRSREPAIDILDVKTAGLRGAKDTELLELAAHQGRIVISHDRETMTGYFRERVNSGKLTAGLFVVPQQPGAIREIIDSLLLVWTASEAEEWWDQIVYFPFR